MSNPILNKLGLSNNDRVVVLHADDIGMCQASVSAYEQLLDSSPLSSAATMVPCPWFPAAAASVRARVEHSKLDMGVHLTLTSEWDAMRWGPVSTGDRASGMFDDEGYFHRQVPPVVASAEISAVETELRAQIEMALAAGIDATHIDTHMGALVQPRFVPLYIRLGFEYRLPTFSMRVSADQLMAMEGYSRENAEQIAMMSAQVEAQGMPMFDGWGMMPLREKLGAAERLDEAKRQLNELPAGLNYFIIHPSTDSAELRALCPDWEARVGDLNLFLSDKWRIALEQSGVHIIGMKALRDLMRSDSKA